MQEKKVKQRSTPSEELFDHMPLEKETSLVVKLTDERL